MRLVGRFLSAFVRRVGIALELHEMARFAALAAGFGAGPEFEATQPS